MAKTLPLGHHARLALLVWPALIPASPAVADVQVIESDVMWIAPLATLKDDEILDVPAQGTVKVLLMPGSIMKVIVGPYRGTAAAYAPSALPEVKPESKLDPASVVTGSQPESQSKGPPPIPPQPQLPPQMVNPEPEP